MEHGSNFVYVYSDSDSESVDLDDADDTDNTDIAGAAASSSARAWALKRNVPLPPPPAVPPASGSALTSLGATLRGLLSRRTQIRQTQSDLPEQEDDATVPPEAPPQPLPTVALKTKKRVREADPNIVTFKFSKLVDPSHMQTGDPIACTECGACLSNLSVLRDGAGEGKVWRCEFCDKENVLVHFSEDQKPSEEDVTYMVEPAPAVQAGQPVGFDESVVVFCIDVSGSMGVTVESGNQHISRLDGVKMAIDQQVTKLCQDYPRRRVCLIAFESRVQVHGDCGAAPVTLASNHDDAQAVIDEARGLSSLRPVSETAGTLRERVRRMRTLGSTALGPALAAALSIAIQTPGSQVIMCTDGLANVGVGSLQSSDQVHTAEPFYEQMKDLAIQHGVSISIVSIEGNDCRLGQLGILADATGGQVNIVDPLQLRDEFGSILESRVLATNVRATLYLHRGLYVRYETSMVNVVTRDVGSVTGDQEITFEYGVRRGQTDARGAVSEAAGGDEAEKKEEKGGAAKVWNPVDELEWLPFQLQLRYTAADGSKALRVFVQRRNLTRDRVRAEQHVNLRVVASHAVQQTAAFAEQAYFTNAQAYNVGMSRKLGLWNTESDADRRVYSAFTDYNHDLVHENVRRARFSSSAVPGSMHDEPARASPLANADDKVAKAVFRAKKKAHFT